MIKKWLSTFDPSYPVALVYMLQASEYHLLEYLKWLTNVGDFRLVQKRKRLVNTNKAKILLTGTILSELLIIASAVCFLVGDGLLNRAIGLIIILALPVLTAFSTILLVLLFKVFIQIPIEAVIGTKTKKIISRNGAVKIAIAGSYGKTTMRELLKTVLSTARKTAAPGGSLNTKLGIAEFARSLQGDEEFIIFELGEYYKGDVDELCRIVGPDIGIITGINEAHLEKFKTIENTVATIFEIESYVAKECLYVNGENFLAHNRASAKSVQYTREGIGEWKVINAKTDLTGTSFDVVIGESKMSLRSDLLGLHQIGPLVVAAYIGYRLGLSLDQIKIGIASTKPFEHRMDYRTDSTGVTTIDDSYNGNPDGVKALIDFLKIQKDRRRIYVTPGLVELGNKSQEIHEEIGRELGESGIEKVILVRNSVTPFIENGLRRSKYAGDIIFFDDALKMFKALPAMTVSGDIVAIQNDWPDQYR
jgi:UDP-N-acetylmuramoyl-tripeptide--D-alanyl-D-alanine ligase